MRQSKFPFSQNHELIFTKGTTESINFISNTWGQTNVTKNDNIVIKTDSLENALLINELYLKNITAIVNGKGPINLVPEIEQSLSTSETELSFKKSKEDFTLFVSKILESSIRYD